MVLFFCIIVACSINYNIFEVLIMNIFGIIVYLMRKFEYEPAPLVLTFVLCPMIENAFRQSLMLSHGSFSIFFERPISVILLSIGIFLLVSPLIPGLKGRRRPTGEDH